jgi:hypothetical protein
VIAIFSKGVEFKGVVEEGIRALIGAGSPVAVLAGFGFGS